MYSEETKSSSSP